MSESYKICLDIGGTKILGAVFDENNEIIYRLKKRTKESRDSTDNVEQVIISVAQEIIEQSGIEKEKIIAIGAGAPGAINQDNGIVLFSPNLPWRNYDIKTPIEEALGIPFYIGNDVNLGVLGEYKYGIAQGCTNVIGFFVGTGMGAGMILDGKLYTGTEQKGAEIGHLILNENGPLCNCGQRGCLEAYSAKSGMTKYILKQVKNGKKCSLAKHIEGGVFKSKYLKKAVESGDKVAIKTVDRSCHYLAIATGNMINTFSPDMVVFGGGVMEAMGDYFLERIAAEVPKYSWPSIRSTVELKTAGLGDDSILYGALSLIEENLAKQQAAAEA